MIVTPIFPSFGTRTLYELGYKRAGVQDIETRVEEAKAKKVAAVKDTKRLVLGPKRSRWK